MSFVNVLTLDVNTADVTMVDIWFSGSIMVVALTTSFVLATAIIGKEAGE